MEFGNEEQLIPGEEIRVSLRRHAASIAWPVTRAALIVLPLLWLRWNLPDDAALFQNIVWYACVIVLGQLAYVLRSWWVERLEVTTNRMLLTEGIITKTVTMMPLVKVTDMTFKHTPVGRVLGYTTLKVESAGEDAALGRIPYLPWRPDVRNSLTSLVFGADPDLADNV